MYMYIYIYIYIYINKIKNSLGKVLVKESFIFFSCPIQGKIHETFHKLTFFRST